MKHKRLDISEPSPLLIDSSHLLINSYDLMPSIDAAEMQGVYEIRKIPPHDANP